MFFILLGIILAIVVGAFAAIKGWPNESAYLAVVFVIGGILLGLFLPATSYEETSETIELVSLTDSVASTGNGVLFYVSVDATNHYTYYTEVETKYAEGNAKAYKSYTVSGNVVIVEDDSYTEAKLVIYKKIAKSSFWTFGGPDEVEYVFYVPTGTVARNVSVG